MPAPEGRRRAATVAAIGAVLAVVATAVWALQGDGDDPEDAAPSSVLDSSSDATTSTDPAAAPASDVPDLPPDASLQAGNRIDGEIPESSASEPSGNFRTICGASHLAYDDPIVAPGQPGASHLHMFFGNTGVDAHSTYESLRTTGDSSCQGGPLNRTGYWAPAVIDGDGMVVLPEFVSVYYKGTGSPEQIAGIADLPPGLRMIAGFDAATGEGLDTFNWYCEVTQDKGPTIPTCPEDELVVVNLPFPPCWDGTNLDAPDHRSHVAYKVRDAATGQESCPRSHPVHLPELTVGIWYAHEGDSADWHLSSDEVPGDDPLPAGSSFHSDWFGAWDPDVQATWTRSCIVEMRNCVDGELGDGTQLASPDDEDDDDAPRRVALPTRP